MSTKKKLSLSYRIDSVTPSHVRLSVFSNMVLVEYEHHQVTRAKAGELCLTVDEFGPFVQHTQPHIVGCVDSEGLTALHKHTGFDLAELMESE